MRLYHITLDVEPGFEERHVMERIDYIVLARSKRDALAQVSEKWDDRRQFHPNRYRIVTVTSCRVIELDEGAWELHATTVECGARCRTAEGAFGGRCEENEPPVGWARSGELKPTRGKATPKNYGPPEGK